ncbi:GRB2-associated-binding protein 2 [Aricia agestis]|uniref:GRB2-associated-binding protein 2 n=1 Tax=Aricia agestis TaxID=91739 RepID=UPI001C205B18|nr:GRB2-associated-binding protein 2 [Aricia agestis]
MSKNIVFEGWLTKSPPIKRIWRTKWRRRWFALRQSGELPGQYFLDYYADRHCRRLKGTINLDFCEQVDAGLHMERSSNGSLDPKLRGSVFTIQTQSRIYHLEADCEAEMERWVDAICKVCGLRATDETNVSGIYQNEINCKEIAMRPIKDGNIAEKATNQPNSTSRNVNNVQNYDSVHFDDQYEDGDTGPYIPISECITGVRAPDTGRTFTFDPKNIIVSSNTPFQRGYHEKNHMYFSQPQIRVNNVEFSENESNLSDDECKSLNASQCNIGDWSAAKSFKKMAVNTSPLESGIENGPPIPPRPPKTFTMGRDLSHRESFQGPKIQEPTENTHEFFSGFPSVRSRRMSHGTAPPSPGHTVHRTDDDEESLTHSMQYCNLLTLPPAVDRALKPRHSSHSIGFTNNCNGRTYSRGSVSDDRRPDVLQYLDLDLHTSRPASSKIPEVVARKTIAHKSQALAEAEAEADSAYKTVDFLKTEAFNITRQDAEASRSNQQ